MVKVYGFRKWDGVSENATSEFKATAEAIDQMQCQIIPGTEEEVAESALDDEGRFKLD